MASSADANLETLDVELVGESDTHDGGPLDLKKLADGTLASIVSILAIIAVVASILNANKSETPPVAEFAADVSEIRSENGLNPFGVGGEGSAEGGVSDTTLTLDPGRDLVEVPRVRRCVGDPPRQTEDPQSPPCVAHFEGPNGGATSIGVTDSEIVVAHPVAIEQLIDVDLLAAHFNSRYELYGRRIRLEPFTPRGGSAGRVDSSAMAADAVRVASEIKAFASIAYPARQGAEAAYYDELARREIVSADTKISLRDRAHFVRQSPYQWGVMPDYETMLAKTGEFACGALAGRNAEHGGTEVASARRTFGLLVAQTSEGRIPSSDTLVRKLDACEATVSFTRTISSKSDDTAEGTSIATAMRSADVTSVICLCPTQHLEQKLMGGAATIGFEPEWILQGFQAQDFESSATNWPQTQARHAFGLSFRNKQLPLQDSPWYWAIREADSTWQPDVQQGFNTALVERYAELLLIASGIQLAGPTLTPETFAAGLKLARFPNPGAGAAPLYQARVGFSSADHTFYGDAAMIWWNPIERNFTANVSQGAFCYVDRGVRPESFQPKRYAFFEGSCR